MKKKIVALTIGHSPRNDIVQELEDICNAKYEIVQCGGLDGIEEEEILDMQSKIDTEEFLITKINSGKMVKVPREFAVNRMKNCFDKEFEQGAEAGIILCTLESFVELDAKKVIIKPQKLLLNFVKTIATDKKLGIIFPSNDLIDVAIENWSKVSSDVFVKVYSSNEPIEKLMTLVGELIDLNVDIIVLDCIGYTVAMKQKVKSVCKVPVILPRTLIINALDELF